MRPILTVTLNPVVDISTTAPAVEAGPKLRCTEPQVDPGGGGVNVSRAIRILGGESVAFVATAGEVGRRLEGLLRREGITMEVFPGPGETREGFSCIDARDGSQYRFVFPGPRWTRARSLEALRAITAAIRPGGLVVLSGSQPPGVPVDFAERLARATARAGAGMVLDTSGEPLRHVADRPGTPIEVLRMDHHEAEFLVGRPLPDRKDTAEFAQSLVRRGVARVVVVARGADGSVIATEDARHHTLAAEVPVVSKIGAGDSFLGAFCLALARGKPLHRAHQEGMAAASAAVMTEATRLCRAADVRRLVKDCKTGRI